MQLNYFSSMIKTLASFFSYLLHPAIIPLVGLTTIFIFSPFYISDNLFLLVAGFVLLGTYIFPLLFMLFLKTFGVISSLKLANAQERRYPYISGAFFFYLTAQSMHNFPIPDYVAKYLMAGVLIIGIAFLFLNYIKLSMHMAGLGGLVALVLYLSYSFNIQLLIVIAGAILLAGLLGTSRLVLGAHTPKEVYLGFILGLFCVSLGLFLF